MTRLRGWAPKGERLVEQGSAGQVEDRDVASTALRNDAARARPACLMDSINGQSVCRAYVDRISSCRLKPGRRRALRTTSILHKGKAVRKAIRWMSGASPGCSCRNTPTSNRHRTGLRQAFKYPAPKGRLALRSYEAHLRKPARRNRFAQYARAAESSPHTSKTPDGRSSDP